MAMIYPFPKTLVQTITFVFSGCNQCPHYRSFQDMSAKIPICKYGGIGQGGLGAILPPGDLTDCVPDWCPVLKQMEKAE